MFQDRQALIVTQHQKEKVIAPVLETALGIRCQVTQGFDTDVFGTFSGEIPRSLSPIETLRNKCLSAARRYGADLVVASEGSFGPHPSLFFVPAGDELVMLMDISNNLEIIGRNLSTHTNFGSATVDSWDELRGFADHHLFPSHALILKSNQGDIRKAIVWWDELRDLFVEMRKSGAVHVETDMRACFNPTRMKEIEQATIHLIAKVRSICPQCSTPGFEVTAVVPGLPCLQCGSATRSTRALTYQCKKCGFTKEQLFPDGIQEGDPAHCDHCNP